MQREPTSPENSASFSVPQLELPLLALCSARLRGMRCCTTTGLNASLRACSVTDVQCQPLLQVVPLNTNTENSFKSAAVFFFQRFFSARVRVRVRTGVKSTEPKFHYASLNSSFPPFPDTFVSGSVSEGNRHSTFVVIGWKFSL